MTLLVSVFAAIISTVLWYKNAPKNEMKYGVLCWLFWGASLMWLVDAIFEYVELKAAYFTPNPRICSTTRSWGCRWSPSPWWSG